MFSLGVFDLVLVVVVAWRRGVLEEVRLDPLASGPAPGYLRPSASGNQPSRLDVICWRDSLMRRPRASFGMGIVLFTAANLTAAGTPARADFPAKWGGGGRGYELTLEKDVKHGGKASGSIKSGENAENFASLTQGFNAQKYRGKRLRLTAYVKSDNLEDWAGLWMRVDGKTKAALAFDNMMERPVKGTTDWTKYEVVLQIPQEAEEIYFGFLVAGKGHAWVDDFTFDTVGDDVKETGQKLEGQDRQGGLTPGLPDEPTNLNFED